MALVLLHRQRWTAGGHGLLEGAATHLSSHARGPRPATSDKTKGSQAQPGRQPQRESARRPVGTLASTSDVTDSRNENSKPHCDSDGLELPGIGSSHAPTSCLWKAPG